MVKFTHLHVHSHFSFLDGMSKIPDLIKKAKKCGMYAMALTDHGNMYGIKEFLDESNKANEKTNDEIKALQKTLDSKQEDDQPITPERENQIQDRINELKSQIFKPIVGIEAYCAHKSRFEKDGRGWHLILLAKNKQGYKNLCKLSSYAFTEGFYYTSRLDHDLLEKYHEGVIACSACLGGEIPQKILAGDIAGAEESVLWFKSVFGDDFYLELQRHKTDKPGGDTSTYERQQEVNKVLLELAAKTNTKIIATNDVHFVEEEHGEAHDRLICISSQDKVSNPNRMHYTKQEWLKSPEEMEAIFSDLPEALANTMEIADKVETYSLKSDPIMPVFPIPAEFGTEEEYHQKYTEDDLFNEFTRDEHGNVVLSQEEAEKKIKKLGGYDRLYRIKLEADYLAKLNWEGAKMRYGDNLTDEQHERIVFELHVMKTMGFPGYFLIVSDYIRAAREELGVMVGPGRGSAAGSVVAYCLKITDIDPLKYDLLFERFLNPDRISLPDIDVDFDDAGRERVLDWVTEKYGAEKVAHIITYGTMATKNSIADVCRVQEISVAESNAIKALVPDKFPENMKDEKGKPLKISVKNCLQYVPEMKALYEGNDENISKMLTYASELEGTNRQIGIHACGVIIGADDLTNFAPICTVDDKKSGKKVIVTQYDGHVVEDVGLIKMDFLGLSTLSIIKEALKNIKLSRGIDVDIDHIPIDDAETFKLFCEGNTVAVFQFESAGMQSNLRELKPNCFEDLIAMNALYRPGPMDYIPDFIARKNGKSAITYDIPCMEQYLKDTYGITVYQEQVMLLSRLLANFTRGESDALRKAMGKKKKDIVDAMKPKFIEGGVANGHDPKILEKIWADWEKFASYAFNKSHATCYSWVAYQTAYLKAHFPAEFMAANLTAESADITRVGQLMDECSKMKIKILQPSVNESIDTFTVNKKGEIRYGIGGLKGVGEAATLAIIEERQNNGVFKDIFDFLKRINLRTVNKRCVESLVKSGALDEFTDLHRATYFYRENDNEGTPTFLDKLIRWGGKQQENANSSQISLFGDSPEMAESLQLEIPKVEEWSSITKANFEKETIGIFLTGHPLDEYKWTMKFYTNIDTQRLAQTANYEQLRDRDLRFAGYVSNAVERTDKHGKPWGALTIEDYNGSFEFRVFGNDFINIRNFFQKGLFVFCRAVIRPRPWGDNPELELKINEISLLEDIFDKRTKSILLNIPIQNISNELCENLQKIAKKCKGSVPLFARVHSPKFDINLSMRSTTLLVNPTKFVKAIEKIPQISSFEVNQK
jgi:DNA polymerase-3 subunit alpha